jgi:LysM repeat protein/ABC-type branched-subunit amino acid transport system substrate-binding protein
MLRKIVCFVFIIITGVGFVFSQTEKSTKTVIKDNMLFYDHEVVKGQTLYGISKMYQVSIDDISIYNPTVKQGLKIGEHLYIPVSKQKVEIHTVKKGETLYTIARSKGVTEKELLMLNQGLNEMLSIGQEIVVPLVEIEVVEEDVTSSISGSSTGNLTRKQRKALKEEAEKSNADKPTSSPRTDYKPEIKVDSVFHIVEKGETLYGISKKYGVTVDAIKAVNAHLHETINISDRIYIPVIEDDTFTDNKNDNKDKSNAIKEYAKKSEYTVYILLPLYLSQVNAIEPTKIKSLFDYNKIAPFSYIQFYEAMLLAVEDISTKYPRIKINLYVEDVATPTQLTELIKTEKLEDADLIIGPFHSQEFTSLCQWAKHKNILLVNPFSSTFENQEAMTYKVIAGNVYQGECFANYILEKHPNANIIFANNQSAQENNQIAAFRSGMQKRFNSTGKNISIQEVRISNNDISSIHLAVNSTKENFLLVFLEGELLITNFTQRLHAAHIENLSLVVPVQWLKYDNIETEYFMELNTHYISQYFIDYSNSKVIRFIDAFRNAYETEPTLDLYGFQGYDFTYYFLSKLCETGIDLQASDTNTDLLSTKFNFILSPDNKNMMENTFAHIFKIKNYRFINAFSDNETNTSSNNPKPRR